MVRFEVIKWNKMADAGTNSIVQSNERRPGADL